MKDRGSSIRGAIGVFDSGIGGLTVVSALMGLMPEEDIIYLGDTARVPYGVRSAGTVRRYAAEGASFLRSKGIKLLVVACNTVSAVGLDEVARYSDVPVVGVIEPGARAAAAASVNGRIGVIGTEATMKSSAYVKAIHSLKQDARVVANPCPLFVPLAEEGWTEGDVPRLAAERYLKEIKEADIDVLVLGCTHYPLLRDVLQEVVGASVRIIDSASETALEVKDALGREGLVREGGQAVASFYVTDSPEKFQSVGERFLKRKIEKIEKIELTEVL